MGSEAAGGDAASRSARSGRLLWALVAVVAMTLVAGAVAGAMRAPATLPEGSPERTVQRYVEALRDGDYAEVVATFSDELARRCPARDFRLDGMRPPVTVTLDEVRVRGDQAFVTVRLRSDGGDPPLPILESAYPQDFVLTRDDAGAWVIDQDPWPIYSCSRPR